MRRIRKGILVASLRSELVENLVRDIESDLSENISIQWKTNSATSVREDSEQRNNRFAHVFLSIPPMEIGTIIFSLKKEVETCLARLFYEKAASSLNEWKMYSEIRSIALLKYDVNLSEIDELPPATISSTSTCVEDTGVKCSHRCIGHCCETFGHFVSDTTTT